MNANDFLFLLGVKTALLSVAAVKEVEFLTGMKTPQAVPVYSGKFVAKSYDVADLVKDGEFEQIVDLIQSVVSPESWEEGGKITPRKPGTLEIVQREEIHAELAELFAKLREQNDIQIGFLIDSVPFDAMPKDKNGDIQWERRKIRVFNGQIGNPTFADPTKQYLVRIQPESATPMPASLAAKNEPIFCMVPPGRKLTVQGVAAEDREQILVSVEVEKETIQTRSFFATPLEKSVK